MLPTTAHIVTVALGGKEEKLYFSFRAWHSLNVNPLRPAEVAEWLQGLDAERAAKWIVAGIGGYQSLIRRLAEQDGETPPSVEVWDVDRVLDLLDIETFGAIVGSISGESERATGEPGNE